VIFCCSFKSKVGPQIYYTDFLVENEILEKLKFYSHAHSGLLY